MYKRWIKRFLDCTLSGIAMIVLLPVYAVVALLVRINMGRPVIFTQERIGKGEKPFRLYKFRSMTDAKDSVGNLLSEEKRLTRTGKFLRSTSLDELPQLLNVFLGQMAIVGPRPLPTYYGPYFRPEERRRHEARGGLISPDELSGRAVTTWEEQFKYESEYPDNITFLGDVKIILITFKILFERSSNDYGADFARPHLNVYRKNEIL